MDSCGRPEEILNALHEIWIIDVVHEGQDVRGESDRGLQSASVLPNLADKARE